MHQSLSQLHTGGKWHSASCLPPAGEVFSNWAHLELFVDCNNKKQVNFYWVLLLVLNSLWKCIDFLPAPG